MMYRGVYRDGVIVPGDGVEFPEGTPIEFAPARRRKTTGRATPKQKATRKKKSKRSRMTAEERVAAFMAGFGISRDVPEWKGRSTEEIARELRRSAAGNWARPRRVKRA